MTRVLRPAGVTCGQLPSKGSRRNGADVAPSLPNSNSQVLHAALIMRSVFPFLQETQFQFSTREKVQLSLPFLIAKRSFRHDDDGDDPPRQWTGPPSLRSTPTSSAHAMVCIWLVVHDVFAHLVPYPSRPSVRPSASSVGGQNVMAGCSSPLAAVHRRWRRTTLQR
jgi:hypothetical protein